MRHASAVGERRLRGRDVGPPVDLARVGRDDLGRGAVRAQRERQAHREVGLARGGRPPDDDERRASVGRAPLPRRQARIPRRLYGPAASMRTSTMPPRSEAGPARCTSRFSRERPARRTQPSARGAANGSRLVRSVVVVVDPPLLPRVDEDRGDAPDALAIAGEADRLLARQEQVQALLLDCRRHVVGEPRRRRARARREGGREDLVVAHRLEQAQGGLELGLRLAAEAHDHVGADGQARDRFAHALQALLVMRDGVLAPHPSEDLVVAGLDREVERRADRRRAGHRVDEAVGQVPGVRRDESQAGNGRPSVGTAQGADRLDQLGEIGPRRAIDSLPGSARLGHVGETALRRQVVPVAVDVLAEERDLAVARGGERPRLLDHLVERPAPLRSPAERHDAVRARLVAAVDDREPRGDRRLTAHGARRDGVGARPGQVIGGRNGNALDQRGRGGARRRGRRRRCARRPRCARRRYRGGPRHRGRAGPGRCGARGRQADRALDGRQAEPLHELRLLVGPQEQVHRREPAAQSGPVALAHGGGYGVQCADGVTSFTR